MPTPCKFGYLIPTRDAVMNAPGGRADIGRMIELAVKAEQQGFDAVWIGDSILAKPRFEPLTTLAAIAALTRRVQLGTAVYLTPLRHPVPLAHQVGNLDLLSGGRLIFGIGTGPAAPNVRTEYAQCSIDFSKRGALQEEGLRIMKGLWTGQPFSFEGKHFQLRDALLHPLPGRAGGPPVLLAGAAERPLRRLVRFADGWLPISHDAAEYTRDWKRIEEICKQEGRDSATLRRIMYITLNINRDTARAEQETEAFVQAYYGPSWKLVVPTQAICAGTPARCAEFIGSFAQAGCREFVVRFSAKDQEPQMQRLLSDVVPLLR